MRITLKTAAVLSACLWLYTPITGIAATQSSPLNLKDGDRVIWVGDSITREGGWCALIEQYYLTRHPEESIEWMNAGISGDTAPGTLRRMDWDVMNRNPTHAVVMLGMNDFGLAMYLGDDPVSDEDRQRPILSYEKAMEGIIKTLIEAGVYTVLCTPSPYDETVDVQRPAGIGASRALAACADITRDLAGKYSLPLVDFYGPMQNMNERIQRQDPGFTLIGKDRVHPGPLGRAVMAFLFLRDIEAPGLTSSLHVDLENKTFDIDRGTVEAIEQTPDGEISFRWKADALPLAVDHAARKALTLVPFTETLNQEVLRVSGLPKTWYTLHMDGQPMGKSHEEELSKGIQLGGIPQTPQYQQALKLNEVHSRIHSIRSGTPRNFAFLRQFTLPKLNVSPDADPELIRAALEEFTARDRKSLPGSLALGGFAYTMAERTLQKWEQRGGNAAVNLWTQVHELRKPESHRFVLKPIEHPLSTAERKSALASRRNPDVLRAFAEDALDRLLLTPDELKASGLDRRAGLVEASQWKQKGHPIRAMEAFRDYYFAKLLSPKEFGIRASAVKSGIDKLPPQKKEQTIQAADRLLEGVRSMQPGELFLPPPPPSPNGAPHPWSPKLFRPLAQAYLLTGEDRYLDQWVDFMDDWAMHQSIAAPVDPMSITDRESGAVDRVMDDLELLAGIAEFMEGREASFPADSLLRMLQKFVNDDLPTSLIYHENNPQNWTPGATARLLEAMALLDEFDASENLFTRSHFRHDAYGTVQFLPDGSETEHALWYNVHYFDGARKALNHALRRTAMPADHLPAWEQAAFTEFWFQTQQRKIEERARFFLQMLTPRREYPIGNRSDRRKHPDWKSKSMIEYAAEHGDPELRTLLNQVLGKADTESPDFTASAFPYGGHWLFRSGWNPDADYAHFFSSPYPTGGHGMRGLRSNNGFWMATGGFDQLVSGAFGSYSHVRSPVRVDGFEAFHHAGIIDPGQGKSHKGFSVAYQDPPPAPWRFYSGPELEMAEGVYDGPYGFFVDDHHDTKDYTVGFLAERALAAIDGITHHRMVFHPRDTQVWVVWDQFQSDSAHRYAVDWRLPLSIEKDFGSERRGKGRNVPFQPDEVTVQNSPPRFYTQSPQRPNLSVAFIGPEADASRVREDAERIQNDYTLNYRMTDFLRLSREWDSEGDSSVFSLIHPFTGTMPPETKIHPIHSDEVNGFSYGLGPDAQLIVLTAASSTSRLDAGPVSAEAKAVLMFREPGMVSGMLLDAETAHINGSSIDLPEPNTAFTIRGGTISLEPIYRPIQPVRITPESDRILPGGTIALHSATSGVEIRYTLDGSEPSLTSPLYTAPFPIRESLTVNARAFRTGLEHMPKTLGGTHMTPVRTAHFSIPELLPAEDEVDTQPGLLASDQSGEWSNLIWNWTHMKWPQAKPVTALFQGFQPNRNATAARQAEGFLRIPETGIYTFHIPDELIMPTEEEGYALRVFLGHKPNTEDQLSEWVPISTRHAYGTWSIALEKGLHPFRMIYVDYRQDAVERFNHPVMKQNLVWDERVPEILITRPDGETAPLPNDWLVHRATP